MQILHRSRMKQLNRLLFSAILILLFAQTVMAQFRFTPGAEYDQHIASPAEFLGYQPGETFTPHHRIEDYLRYLADKSDRVLLQKYGQTYESRPLLLLIISSPAHLRDLEKIRKDHARLRDKTATGRESLITTLPAVAWLSYGVHGNESSSAETALQVAWTLAAARDSLTRAILTNLVVIIDPLLNPDGRERYVNWYRSAAGNRANADPNSVEHIEPWPGGRGNHYYFDLNRDWAWATQKETRARLRVYREWYPQVHVDFHEMGANSSYFFFPPQGPILQDLPASTLTWMERYGQANARAFDRRGWPYYTAENFDLFYPGYGDSWPSINGAIGMTYEQAGHGAAGALYRRKDGTLLTLADRIRHHFVSSLTTLQTTAAHRVERLRDYAAFWKKGAKDAFKGYILQSMASQARLQELVHTLRMQGIDVLQVDEQRKVSGAVHVVDGEKKAIRLSAQDYFVPLDQQNSRQVRILFEPNPALSDTFFYDITSWSMPAAFGVHAYRVKKSPRTTRGKASPAVRETDAADPPYAWVLPWDDVPSAGFLSDLLEENVRCYATRKTIQVGSREFRPGSIIIPRWANTQKKNLSGLIRRLSTKWAVSPQRLSTGLTLKGPDLGSTNNVAWIPAPATAVLTGEGISPTSYGAVWFLFDQKIEHPFAALPLRSLRRVDLARYKTLVMPDAFAPWSTLLDSVTVKKLRHWLQSGGRLIAIGSATEFLTQGKKSISKITMRKDTTAAKEKKKKDEEKARQTWQEKQHQRMLNRVSGAVYRMHVDITHPIGFGLERQIFTIKRGTRAFDLTGKAHHAGIFQNDAWTAGYISKENRSLLKNSSGVAVERVGKGVLILFADDPNFRMFWRVTSALFLNAVFFGSMM